MSATNEKPVLLAMLAASVLLGGGTFLFLMRHQQSRPTTPVTPPPPTRVQSSFAASTPPSPEPTGTPAQEMFDAAAHGDVSRVNELLHEHPEVVNENNGNAYGSTPLHFAAYSGHDSVIGPLLLSGANVNARNSKGLTPLMDAAGNGKKDAVEFLLGNGANPNLKDPVGRTALDFAREKKWDEIAGIIQKNIRIPRPPRRLPPAWNNEEVTGRAFENLLQIVSFANEHGYLIYGKFPGEPQWPAKVVSITETNNSISFQLKSGPRHDYRNYQGYSLKLLRFEDAAGRESAFLLCSKERIYSDEASGAPPAAQPQNSAPNAASGNGNFRVTQRMLAQKFESEQRDLGATNAQTLQTLQRLADVSACADDWAGCVRYSRMLMAQTNCDLLILRGCAVAALLADDSQTYREVCRRLLSESGPTPSPLNAERIAKVCLLAPGSVAGLTPVRQLADLAVKARPEVVWVILVKGMAEFRSDQPSEAVRTLDSLRENSNPDIAGMAGYLMAMSCQQMNQPDKAKTFLTGADRHFQWSDSMARRQEWRWFEHAATRAIRDEANKMVLGQ